MSPTDADTTLSLRIESAMRDAMRARDDRRTQTLRMAMAAAHNQRIARGRELTDEEVAEEATVAPEIEPELVGEATDPLWREIVLVGEERVIHRPEGALRIRRLDRLGGQLRAAVHVVERQVAPDVAHVADLGEQLADAALRPTAVRALEVAVLDERHRRVRGPANVVPPGIDGSSEIDDRLRRPDQRAEPEADGEERGGAETACGHHRRRDRRADGGPCAAPARRRCPRLRASNRAQRHWRRDSA